SQGFLLDAGEAIYNFTGAYPAYYKANQVDPQTIASAAQAGKVIVLTTPGSGATTTLDPGTGIVAWHAYALVDMKSVNGQWLVTLYNPWGRDGNAAPKDGVDDGRLTVPWTTVATYFNSIRVA
ncbi:MAG: C2 family cysteine protease, partial [Gemmataceae bacterium]